MTKNNRRFDDIFHEKVITEDNYEEEDLGNEDGSQDRGLWIPAEHKIALLVFSLL